MNENNGNALSGVIFDETTEITIVELCEVCAIDQETVNRLIAEGIIEPTDSNHDNARLPYTSVKRTRTVVRLQRDLGVNMAGAALALELLERIEKLRAQLRLRHS